MSDYYTRSTVYDRAGLQVGVIETMIPDHDEWRIRRPAAEAPPALPDQPVIDLLSDLAKRRAAEQSQCRLGESHHWVPRRESGTGSAAVYVEKCDCGATWRNGQVVFQ